MSLALLNHLQSTNASIIGRRHQGGGPQATHCATVPAPSAEGTDCLLVLPGMTPCSQGSRATCTCTGESNWTSQGHSSVLQPTPERSGLTCSSTPRDPLRPMAALDRPNGLQTCHWVIPRFNREVRSIRTDGEKGPQLAGHSPGPSLFTVTGWHPSKLARVADLWVSMPKYTIENCVLHIVQMVPFCPTVPRPKLLSLKHF